MRNVLQSRARGCLVGLAAGNMLGLPNEFLRRRPEVPVRDIELVELDRPWDDDLAQAFELAESLAKHGRVDVPDLAARLVRWARTNGRGMGGQTRQVLERMAAGLHPLAAARWVWERSDRNAAGNGGVMRVAPIGLRFHSDVAACVAAAEEATALTHCDPRCTQSAAAVAAGVAALLRGESALEAALEAVRSLPASEPEVLRALESIPELELEDIPIRSGGIGYTITCAVVGLWAAEQPGSLEQVLLDVVNAGGDADTNAAVAGALLGARHGDEALPVRWLERIRRRSELARVAERLVQA